MAQFRQHKRVTLVNKGHRKVRAARQDLYPVELQTCGKYMQLFLFPLFHRQVIAHLDQLSFLLMADLCGNRLK